MDIRLDHNGQNIFTFRGWPTIECHFRSDDGDLQADLVFALNTVTTLPDCLLPIACLPCGIHGGVRGTVRHLDRSIDVKGHVFFDHTRSFVGRIPRPTHCMCIPPLFRQRRGLFGYHSVDGGRLVAGTISTFILMQQARANFLKTPC